MSITEFISAATQIGPYTTLIPHSLKFEREYILAQLKLCSVTCASIHLDCTGMRLALAISQCCAPIIAKPVRPGHHDQSVAK